MDTSSTSHISYESNDATVGRRQLATLADAVAGNGSLVRVAQTSFVMTLTPRDSADSTDTLEYSSQDHAKDQLDLAGVSAETIALLQPTLWVEKASGWARAVSTCMPESSSSYVGLLYTTTICNCCVDYSKFQFTWQVCERALHAAHAHAHMQMHTRPW